MAIDSDYVIWRAFKNNYWPALYFVDSQDAFGISISARVHTRVGMVIKLLMGWRRRYQHGPYSSARPEVAAIGARQVSWGLCRVRAKRGLAGQFR